MKIAVVSDIHNGYLIECRPGEESIPLLNSFLSYCEEENVDIILELGDRVNNRNHDFDIENLKAVSSLFRKSKIPVYHAMGNHDIHYINKQENLDCLGYAKSYYSVETKEFVILVLDSTDRIIGDCGGYIGDVQREWLKEQLRTNNKPIIICSHHPLVEQYQKGNPFFVSLPDEYKIINEKEILEIISEYCNKIALIINGHVHWNYLKYCNGIPCFSVASLLENYPLKENAPGRFSIFDCFDNKIMCSSLMINPFRTLGMFELR